MMWLQRAMGNRTPAISPIENNPVGWSSIYAPEVATNPSPDVSPLASALAMTPEQKVGRFWNLATGQAKPAYTNADLPQLSAAGNEALDSGMGWASTTPIRAYHGSPHTFDRFDMSKIGTGEGAQAYGHGLYFAGNEGVARSYREVLAGASPELKEAYARHATPNGYLYVGRGNNAQTYSDPKWLARDAAKYPEIMRDLPTELQNAIRNHASPGSMYEVALRTSPERLLDWDKPLAQQPIEARNIADTLARIPPQGLAPKSINTGADIYNSMRNPRAAKELGFKNWSSSGPAQYLKETGLDGIQYLDAGSRAAGDGSRNYVMFRDDIIDILRRYGLFGLGMTGGAMGAAQQYAPQGAEQ